MNLVPLNSSGFNPRLNITFFQGRHHQASSTDPTNDALSMENTFDSLQGTPRATLTAPPVPEIPTGRQPSARNEPLPAVTGPANAISQRSMS
ncbi:hypothetical protein CSOJ01_11252 [Colletotrichum sojae]|uniref:Uncharacterized protein n=1 Tax=Colletotrichum sojae TaxID=2175907 RepID=A0A8H6IY78_9PEZI|nr:hypothetical protein CSOJ01_11252 [Colletotrichum sojae]